ncbi:MAG: hypothetical protein HUJ94_08450 [Bacteroidales bacterium]|nr:hypothetical protein [Bacteroidales bacterium]
MRFNTGNIIKLTAAVLAVLSCGEEEKGGGTDDDGGQDVDPIEWIIPGDNQIVRGKVLADLKSAVYDPYQSDGVIFWFSTAEGLETVDEILKAGPYLKIKANSADGEIDLKEASYSIEYESFSFDQSKVKHLDLGKLELRLEGRSSVSLNLEVRMLSTDRIAAKYSGKCVKQMQRLSNQFEVDGTSDHTATIGSVLQWNCEKDGTVFYYLYEQEGISEFDPKLEPAVTLKAKAGTDLSEIDFSKVSAEEVLLTSGEFSTADKAEGIFSLSIQPMLGTVNISADLTTGKDVNFRASYNRGYASAYKSENMLRRYDKEGKLISETALAKVWRKLPYNVSIELLMGDKTDAEIAEQLMEGTYAAALSIPPDMAGTSCSAEDVSKYTFNVLDYQTYDVIRSEKGAAGSYLVKMVDGKESHIYFSYAITLSATGEKVEAEYYGPLAEAAEDLDLTPVAPFHNHFGIYKPNGDKVIERDVTSVQIRRETDVTHTLTAERYPEVYYFYFVNMYTQYNGIDGTNATPCLMVNPEYINKGEIDLTKAEKCYALWYSTNYMYLLSSMGVIGTAPGYGPSVATLDIRQGEDGYYEIDMYVYDWGKANSYTQTDYGNKYDFRIAWRGKVSPYTGQKKNEW